MIAALGADGFYVEGAAKQPKAVEWRLIGNVGDLLRGLRAHGADVLYVHRSALGPLGLPDELEPPPPGERRPRHPWLEGVTFEGQRVSHSALTPSIECGGLEVLIGAYQDGAGDPFDEARDARELLAAALAFRDAFAGKGRSRGWSYRNSAAQTGWKLMHAPWERGARKSRVADFRTGTRSPQPELEGVPPGSQVEVPYGGKWAAPTNDEEEQDFVAKRYVMAWDVNGQRLAATARLSLGIGGLQYWRRGIARRADGMDVEPDLKLPGYHLVRSVENPFPGLIPPIFEPGWHTTPRVAMAHYLGIGIEVEQSWVWTEHVPYLNPWYEAMRDARAQLLAAREEVSAAAVTLDGRAAAIALGALKQSYLQPLGRLRSARLRERNDPLYRPDWYDHVIGQELAREYLRLYQLAKADVRVLAVYFDTIIIESDSCDPVAGAPRAIEVSEQLGKYKPLGVLEQGAAFEALYGGERSPDVGALVKALKAAGVRTQPVPPTGPPVALSAFTRPTHGGYPDAIAALRREGMA